MTSSPPHMPQHTTKHNTVCAAWPVPSKHHPQRLPHTAGNTGLLTVGSALLRAQTGGALPCSPAAPSRSWCPTGTRCGGCGGRRHCRAGRHARRPHSRLHAAAARPTEAATIAGAAAQGGCLCERPPRRVLRASQTSCQLPCCTHDPRPLLHRHVSTAPCWP